MAMVSWYLSLAPFPFPCLFIGVDHILRNGVQATVSGPYGLWNGDIMDDDKMVRQQIMDDDATT